MVSEQASCVLLCPLYRALAIPAASSVRCLALSFVSDIWLYQCSLSFRIPILQQVYTSRLIQDLLCILPCRVFRTMFKEFKPSSGRLSSPLLRRRIPTVTHQYMSPQNSRKSRIPGIGRMKKKRSVPEGLARVASPESSAMPVAPAFCEDPRNLQIKEQVGVCVCICVCVLSICHVCVRP